LEEIFLTEQEKEAILWQRRRKKEKSDLKRITAFIGLAYFIQMLLPYLFSIGISFASVFFGFSEELLTLYEDNGFLMFLQVVLSIAAFVFPYLMVLPGIKKCGGGLLSFGLPKKGTILPLILMGFGFCAFGNIATNVISTLFELVGINFSSPEFEYPEGFSGVILVIIAVAVVPALVEEFAMRGVIMGGLRPFGKGFAIAMSALVFGMMHGNFVQLPFAFVMGIFLGYAAIKSGSIWVAVVIHLVNNLTAVALEYIFDAVGKPETQSVFISVYFAICFLCFFIGLVLTGKNSEDFWKREPTDRSITLKEQVCIFLFSPVTILNAVMTFFMCLAYVSI
jgi:membrane protease YdiL (CAAX protease family)